MKKRLFAALGATGVATALIFTLTLSSGQSNASQNKRNVDALEIDLPSDGKCTGPRPQGGNCESSNTNKCSDTAGCSS